MNLRQWVRGVMGYPQGAARGIGAARLSTASESVSAEARNLQQNLRRIRLEHEYPLVELASRIAGEPVEIVRKEKK